MPQVQLKALDFVLPAVKTLPACPNFEVQSIGRDMYAGHKSAIFSIPMKSLQTSVFRMSLAPLAVLCLVRWVVLMFCPHRTAPTRSTKTGHGGGAENPDQPDRADKDHGE